MRSFKRFLSLIISFMLMITIVSFYGCKNKNDDDSYIDLDKSLKAYQNYAYYNNTFLNDIYLDYASDDNVGEIKWFYEEKEGNINIWFENIIKQLKAFTEDSILSSTSDIIEKTSNTLSINYRGDVLKIQTKNNYESLQVLIESDESFAMYEFICTGEGVYSSQLVFKTDLTYLIYQMNFNGLSGEIAVFHNKSEYTSIYSEGVKNDFANKNTASYYFD